MKLATVFLPACLATLAAFVPADVFAAGYSWQTNIAFTSIDPNGESSLLRPNGKTVTTSMDRQTGMELAVRYQVSDRIGVSAGFLGNSTHTIVLHQDFPDDTDFETSDTFRFNALTIGLPVSLSPTRNWDFYVEPFLAYVMFDDVFLESAGPPFDIDMPLDLNVDDKLGFGAALGFDYPVAGDRWVLHAGARILVAKFDGQTSEDPSNPGFSSSMELDFNALLLSAGVGYRF